MTKDVEGGGSQGGARETVKEPLSPEREREGERETKDVEGGSSDYGAVSGRPVETAFGRIGMIRRHLAPIQNIVYYCLAMLKHCFLSWY
jgi:hypothetical protein